MQLTPQQAGALQGLVGHGFQIVAFPMYESYVGVRKGNCATLLSPQSSGGLSTYGQPAYLVGGQFGVEMFHSDGHYFVSKKDKFAATPERNNGIQEVRRRTRRCASSHRLTLLDSLLEIYPQNLDF